MAGTKGVIPPQFQKFVKGAGGSNNPVPTQKHAHVQYGEAKPPMKKGK